MAIKQGKIILLLCFCFQLNIAVFSQLKGVVTDKEKSRPISGASIFINNTDIATQTDETGSFWLEGISEGFAEVVIYKKGFTLFKSSIMLEKAKVYTLNLNLSVQKKINKKSKGNSLANQIEFQKKFCGVTNLDSCRIINLKELQIEKSTSGWIIQSSNPIEIENQMLGYRVTLYNEQFSFVDLPDFSTLALKFSNIQNNSHLFKTKRTNQYLGSLAHFFLSTSLRLSKHEGFTIIDSLGRSIDVAVSTSKISGYNEINLKGRFRIEYKNDNKIEKSILKSEGNIAVNGLGQRLNANAIEVSGAMAERGFTTILPFNFIKELADGQSRAEEIQAFEEKVYIHTDKPYYYPGDVMWFKAYLNFRSPQLRDSLSKTLHVDLFNKHGKIILSKVYRIDSGLSKGDIIFPDTLRSQNCFLRAYTSFSRNFGDEKLYTKQIPVLAITEKISSSRTSEPAKGDLLKITSPKKKYRPREKIELAISVKDEIKNRNLTANLSVSVVDMKQVVPISLPSIRHDFLFYKSDLSPQVSEVIYPVESGITPNGRVTNERGKPAKVLLTAFQLKPLNTQVAETNANGEFRFTNLVFYDSSNFTFQIGKTSNYYSKVDFIPTGKPTFKLNAQVQQFDIENTEYRQRNFSEFEIDKDAIMLQAITVEAKKEEKVVNFRPYGRADYIIPSSRIRLEYSNILYSLQGQIAGLRVSPETGSVRFTRAEQLKGGNMDPLVTVNDIPVNISILMAIDPTTVESIEVTKRINVLYGSEGRNGVIAIYTKKGPTGNEQTENMPFATAMGYSRPRQFRFPNYEAESKNASPGRDERATLYWNPELKINSSGLGKVVFYAADLPTRYRVTIEGITEGNIPVRGEYELEIEK